MKVEFKKSIEQDIDWIDFCGLCVDDDGDIWFFLEENCFWVSGDMDFGLYDKEEVIKKEGPFTKFTGSLTISN